MWPLYFSWGEAKKLDEVVSYNGVDKGRIELAQLVAVPLFSITRIEDVTALMERVATGR